jgi:dipeptidase D
MVQLVREAIEELDARLASWHGGNMRNAIPFKAEVVLTLPGENVEALKELAEDWKKTFNDEFKIIEPQGIEVIVEEVETPKTELPEEIQDNLVDAIYACHDGVIRYIPSYPNVVETSSNLAIIDIEGGSAAIRILARSSREDMKDYVVKTLQSCFAMAGMKVETAGSYGGWDPNPDSEILHLLLKEYKELFGQDGIIQVDHAGLECSVILGKYPWLDVVSLGPTMKSPHTTTERALIATVEPFWQLLKQTLEDVPEK